MSNSCCMPIIGNIISMHNKAILHQIERKILDQTKILDQRCNLGPNKNADCVRGNLTSQNKAMVYYGSCETKFKIR